MVKVMLALHREINLLSIHRLLVILIICALIFTDEIDIGTVMSCLSF